MGRVIAACAVALSLVCAVTALAANVKLPTLFASQIDKINSSSKAPPVLLPGSLALDVKHAYPSGGPLGAGYDLEIGAVKNCRGADACFVADFQAHKGGKVFGRPVTVRGASKAGYIGLSCGASCSPPQVDYVVAGVLYSIQANTGRHNAKSELIAAADASIGAGPR